MKLGKPEKTYYYENPTKPEANIIVIYLISFSYVVMLALGIIAVVNCVHGNYKIAVGIGVGLLCYTVLLRIYDKTHTWETGKVIYFYKDKIVYRFDGLISVMGHTESTCTFKRIDDIKVDKNKIIISGDIITREPLGKDKKHDKISIPIGIDNQEECLELMKNWF